MNVVLICLDTYRADYVAAAGRNDFIRTPNLDRLAREGVLFDNAFGEGQPTIQYRRAMITGRRAFPFDGGCDTIGLWPTNPGWHKVPPEHPTLAEILLEHGYATGLVADTYHMFKPTQNYTRGMASWDFIRGQETDNYRSGPIGAVDLTKYTRKGITKASGLGVIVQYLLNMQDRRGEMDYLPAKVFTSAIRFLEDNKDNRPFFLWVDCFDPHEPYDPPREFADGYDPDWDEDWEPIYGIPNDADEKIQRRVKALYAGSCAFVDKQVGRLLDALDALALADDTLVLVTSDHGCEMWDHGAQLKGDHKCRYRCNNEILCLARLPGRDFAGTRVSGFVMNHDFFPTILNYLGVAHPPVDGLDVAPLVTGERDALRDHVVTGWAGGGSGIYACVRDHAFNYSCNHQSDDLDEHLFDLRADSGETANVAADRPEVVAEYRGRLESFLGEPLPAKPRHTTFYTPAPCNVWLDGADWAKSLKQYL